MDLFLNANDIKEVVLPRLTMMPYFVALHRMVLPKTFDDSIRFIKVMCNIVERNVFGENVLCTVPVHKNDMSPDFIFEPVNLKYLPLSTTQFQRIHFDFYNENNKQVVFESGKILISLVFVNRH
jgi:hypothetical protein